MSHEKNNICNFCGKTFKTLNYLKTHQKTKYCLEYQNKINNKNEEKIIMNEEIKKEESKSLNELENFKKDDNKIGLISIEKNISKLDEYKKWRDSYDYSSDISFSDYMKSKIPELSKFDNKINEQQNDINNEILKKKIDFLESENRSQIKEIYQLKKKYNDLYTKINDLENNHQRSFQKLLLHIVEISLRPNNINYNYDDTKEGVIPEYLYSNQQEYVDMEQVLKNNEINNNTYMNYKPEQNMDTRDSDGNINWIKFEENFNNFERYFQDKKYMNDNK